ncbi:MAG: tetratricopeptide repeat protein [Bacteroidales bacterium]|jgi:tetratricopeptide (TPR) repeat protein|nr:tetratricopeptide repeat protein [Bacteroidales bacterium]
MKKIRILCVFCCLVISNIMISRGDTLSLASPVLLPDTTADLWMPVSESDFPDTLSPEKAFAMANASYQNARYEEALALYTRIVNKGYEGSVLFYNMGNACYKIGDKAHALLWYERALRLSPSNEDIKHNIAFVKQQLMDKIEPLPQFAITRWWNALSGSMTSNQWTIASIVFTVLLLLSILLFLVSKRSWVRAFSLTLFIVTLLLLTASLLFAHREKQHYISNPEAILIESVATAKSTPNPSGSDLFVIHEGIKIIITDKAADWYEIKLPNGEKGWLPKESMEII